MQLLPILKTGLLFFIYIITPPVLVYWITYLSCKSGGCSGIPAALFLLFLWGISFIISIIILIAKSRKKTKMKQWQLFFIANGFFAFPFLTFLVSLIDILN